jgi:hypothetical protein
MGLVREDRLTSVSTAGSITLACRLLFLLEWADSCRVSVSSGTISTFVRNCADSTKINSKRHVHSQQNKMDHLCPKDRLLRGLPPVEERPQRRDAQVAPNHCLCPRVAD